MKSTKKSAILLKALAVVWGLLLATSGAALAWDGTEGCTPGYWKNHTDNWCAYTPGTIFKDVFGVTECTILNDMTLLQVLKNGGGGESALGRHAVAALLNGSCYPTVDYLFEPEDIEKWVKAACTNGELETLKDMFAYENEEGCPLN